MQVQQEFILMVALLLCVQGSLLLDLKAFLGALPVKLEAKVIFR